MHANCEFSILLNWNLYVIHHIFAHPFQYKQCTVSLQHNATPTHTRYFLRCFSNKRWRHRWQYRNKVFSDFFVCKYFDYPFFMLALNVNWLILFRDSFVAWNRLYDLFLLPLLLPMSSYRLWAVFGFVDQVLVYTYTLRSRYNVFVDAVRLH